MEAPASELSLLAIEVEELIKCLEVDRARPVE